MDCESAQESPTSAAITAFNALSTSDSPTSSVSPPVPLWAAVRCRCRTDLSGPLLHEFDELGLNELIEVRRCLERELVHVLPFQHYPQHRCNEHCWLFNHREAYVCVRSDSIHLCTSDRCDRMIVSSEGIEVCELTGKVFGSEYQSTYSQNPQASEGFANYQRSRGVHASTQAKVDSLAVKIFRDPHAPKVKRPKRLVSAAVQTKLTAGWEIDKPAILAFVTKLFVHASVDETKRQELATIVHDRWKSILATRLFRSSGSTYTLQAHVISMLYCMSEGGDRCDIPSVPWLQQQLPALRHLPHVLEADGATLFKHFTARSKQLHAFMDDWRKSGRPTTFAQF
jgi:hypothetical protein